MVQTSHGVDIAVVLFERGYPEAQIAEAIKACSSLEEAVLFLNSETPKVASMHPTERPRRRAHGKTAPAAVISPVEEMSLTVGHSALLQRVLERPKGKSEDLSGSAAPSSSETADGTAESGDHELSVAASPVGSRRRAESPQEAIDLPQGPWPVRPPRPVRAIEHNEQGMQWWKEAASRWPRIYENLRLEAYLNIVQPECPEVAEYLVRLRKKGSLSTPRKRAASEGRMVANKKVCQEGASAMGVLPTPSRASVDGKSPGRCSSPKAMQLNSQDDVCKICCCDTSPWRSVRLACGHGWYCASCMLRHAEARLEMGAASITCPECSAILAERDLRKLLPTETIDRLLARSLEQAVNCAADIRACPTPNCPMRVALEEGDVARFKCTMCKKESCLRCGRQPFHRGLTCEEYSEKMKNNTKAAKKERQADRLFEQWMQETGTKQCPCCRMAVTKQNLDRQQTQYSECHKMSCRNCGTKFCFKCLAILSESFTCGCTIDAHGFINPVTGRIVKHLKKRAKKLKAFRSVQLFTSAALLKSVDGA